MAMKHCTCGRTEPTNGEADRYVICKGHAVAFPRSTEMPALAVEFQELSLRRKLCDSSVPLHIHSAIVAYVCNRQIPGSFLQAVIKQYVLW
jgi:hypothetical protein